MTKLNEESFRPLFGTWWPKFEKFFKIIQNGTKISTLKENGELDIFRST